AIPDLVSAADVLPHAPEDPKRAGAPVHSPALNQLSTPTRKPGVRVRLGIGDRSNQVVSASLTPGDVFPITGGPGRGRTNALTLITSQLRELGMPTRLLSELALSVA